MKRLFLLAGLATLCSPLGAQAPVPIPSQTTSDIRGVVEDSNGAVIAGAQVTVVNRTTGVNWPATTDAAGGFVVLGLPPGTYYVEVTASGFAKHRVDDVQVIPGRTASLRLRLGGGPIPIPSAANSSQNSGSSVVEWSVADANSLEQRLATKAEDGFALQAVVGTVAGKSLFVFDRRADARPTYVVVALRTALTPESLGKAVVAQNGMTLLGVHTLAVNSHLLVFRNGR